MFEVRFENGVSHLLPDSVCGFADAAESSIDHLLACLPPGARRENIIKPTIIRDLRCPVCYLCGHILRSSIGQITVDPAHGGKAMLCMGCAASVMREVLQRSAAPPGPPASACPACGVHHPDQCTCSPEERRRAAAEKGLI